VEIARTSGLEEARRKVAIKRAPTAFLRVPSLTYAQNQGILEYHVPAQYTQDRPPINYTHIVEPMPLAEHPLGAHLPQPNGELQCFADMGHFRVLSDERSNMKLLKDWIYADKAQLGLDIINFQDATLVTITWLHTLLDAMGRHALLRAWQAVLEGRDDDVPPFIGYDTNPFASLGSKDSTTEPFVLASKQISKFGFARFIFNYIYESYFYPLEEGRMVCMPASYLAKLKARAYADLETLPKEQVTFSTSDPTQPFLSDGDIINAFLLPIIARINPSVANSAPTRLIAVGNTMGMRDVLRNTEPPLLPKNGAYIHNCVIPIWSFFTIDEWMNLPIGHIAARIRADLVAQSTRAQLDARQALAEKGGVLFGSGDMAMTNMSNWSKARLFETDFSAAIVNDGGKGNGGKPRYIHPFATQDGLSLRNAATCVGKDGDGNLWMGCMMRKELVEEFVKEIERLA
jgi:hypothetical protein